MQIDFKMEDFEKSNFKWCFILKLWIGPAWMNLYESKDILYYAVLFLWMLFVFSKFLPNNYFIIIDHINILNFLNVILIFVFLIIAWLIMWIISLFIIDIIFLVFGYFLKLLWKIQEWLFKKNWFDFKIESDTKYKIYMWINVIFCIWFMILLIMGFSIQSKDNNDVIIKTTYSQESFTWTLDYFSGENYIIRWSNWYLVIPKDKVEYLFYPKIEQKKTWNQ